MIPWSLVEMENSTTAEPDRSRFDLIDVVLLPAYAVVILLGLCGNFFVIAAVKTKRSMRTTTNYLLVNLAVADMLNLVWCVPGLAMSHVVHPEGIPGHILCKFVTRHHVAGIMQLVSGLTLTILAAERYKALFHPLATRSRLGRKSVRYPIICVWLSAVAYVVPLFVFENYNSVIKDCEIQWQSNWFVSAMVYWGILALVVLIASLTILFCYFNIIKGLYFSKTICSRGSASSTGSSRNKSPSNDRDQAEKRKIVKMLLSVTVVFFVCFLPFVVLSAVLIDTKYAVLYKLCYFLVYLSSCLNPIIYAFHSSNYREAFSELVLAATLRLECNLPRHNRSIRSDFELKATNRASSVPSDEHQQQIDCSFKNIKIVNCSNIAR